jgi:uncharacterized protein (TIGR01777 family)
MKISEQTILIAGGTGLIGRAMQRTLERQHASVRILTRKPKAKNEYYWNPYKKELDPKSLEQVTVLINLSGAGIADGRWTKKRKEELERSRVESNAFLYGFINSMPELKRFISASGINAYEPNQQRIANEDDPFGKPFLCQLTRKWEESALPFSTAVPVSIIRTAVVLSANGGAYPKLAGITKYFLGSGLGSGKQLIPWIHIDDLTAIYMHTIEKELNGPINAVASCDTNKEFMQKIAESLKKPFFLPNIPGWMMKLVLGEMSTMLLDGVNASNHKLIDTGFKFIYPELSKAFNQLASESK